MLQLAIRVRRRLMMMAMAMAMIVLVPMKTVVCNCIDVEKDVQHGGANSNACREGIYVRSA